MFKKTNSGQSIVEFFVVMGLLMFPLMVGGLKWAKKEWQKTELAYQTFKKARIQMIRTNLPIVHEGVTILPLEDLDKNKKALQLDELMNVVLSPFGP